MIDLYYWPTPNGHKITMLLEEMGAPYQIKPINIRQGEQFASDFLKVAPNNRIPAIVDQAPSDGGPAVSVFESGAILLYLAEKNQQFIPAELRARWCCLEWLFWQVGGLGPMAGQNHHFVQYAPEPIAYAVARYVNETARLYGVLNKHLSDGRPFIVGDDYSIADMACYPWIVPHQNQKQSLQDFPALAKWFEAIARRPATERAYAVGESIAAHAQMDDAAKKILFGQNAQTVR
jgi:GST-like protein